MGDVLGEFPHRPSSVLLSYVVMSSYGILLLLGLLIWTCSSSKLASQVVLRVVSFPVLLGVVPIPSNRGHSIEVSREGRLKPLTVSTHKRHQQNDTVLRLQ